MLPRRLFFFYLFSFSSNVKLTWSCGSAGRVSNFTSTPFFPTNSLFTLFFIGLPNKHEIITVTSFDTSNWQSKISKYNSELELNFEECLIHYRCGCRKSWELTLRANRYTYICYCWLRFLAIADEIAVYISHDVTKTRPVSFLTR